MISPHPHEPDLWVDKCEVLHCFWNLAVKTPEPFPHPCPWAGGHTKIAWSVTVTLVEQAWAILDSHMDEIALLDANDTSTEALELRANLKGRARGCAEIIVIFMTPHFNNVNEVAREAGRRQRARQEADDAYETAGLRSRSHEPPPGFDPVKYKQEPIKLDALVKKVGGMEQAEKIERAYDAFPKDMLAKTFNVTEAEIDKIVNTVRARKSAGV